MAKTREMKDIHPLLVLSPREFNARTGIVIGLPMTTASYNDTKPFAIRFVGAKGPLSYILGHQAKSFDWRARQRSRRFDRLRSQISPTAKFALVGLCYM